MTDCERRLSENPDYAQGYSHGRRDGLEGILSFLRRDLQVDENGDNACGAEPMAGWETGYCAGLRTAYRALAQQINAAGKADQEHGVPLMRSTPVQPSSAAPEAAPPSQQSSENVPDRDVILEEAALIADQHPDTLESTGGAGSGKFRATSRTAIAIRALKGKP